MTPARLAELIRTNQPCVVLTGAGVSTESGIPDFRSEDGLWAEFDPADYASLASFQRDPVRIWDFYARRFAFLVEAEPNDGHRALARLEAIGLVEAVVTQNIDLLHERAGSRDVLEVHGSIRQAVCLACGGTEQLADVLAQLAHAPAPRCPDCGAVLKPDVVFFGELLPAAAIERAIRLARRARLLLVVGSSLEVHPVAALPYETLGTGGALAIVNRGPTPLDAHADLRLDGSAGEILSEVVGLLEEALGERKGPPGVSPGG
jgi:NAD-dependent deacetylase